MSGDEEYNEGEVLTGAELYLYLLRQNEEQQERAQAKLQEYSALKETLQVLTERSRRHVLAPVAGGLAYFPAELNATNTILVLLGDSWFAERSAVQAAEVAGRRLDFLRREAEVLKQEQNSLRSKQELFLSEMPEAQDAVAQLLAETEVHRSGLGSNAAPVLEPSKEAPLAATPIEIPPQRLCSASATTLSSTAETSATAKSLGAATQQAGGESLATTSSSAAAAAAAVDDHAELDYAAVDAALATFDEEDDLTEDELIALEKELGDRLDDDAYVEQVMTERMIAKKERRVRAELQRREVAALEASAAGAATAAAMHSVAAAAPPATLPGHKEDAVAEHVEAASAAVSATFRTPADIGGGCARESTSLPCAPAVVEHRDAVAAPCFSPEASASPSPTTSTSSSSGRKAKHVHFQDFTAEEANEDSALLASAGRPEELLHPHTAEASEVGTAAAGGGAAAASQPAPSLLRSTYKIGDIVEHSVEQNAAAAAPPLPLLPTQPQKPKRKSLFMRDLEGDAS